MCLEEYRIWERQVSRRMNKDRRNGKGQEKRGERRNENNGDAKRLSKEFRCSRYRERKKRSFLLCSMYENFMISL